MNPESRFNTFWFGLLSGLLFPGVIFIFYWMFFHHQLSFPERFIRYLQNGYLLSNVIKMCGLGNLLIFYLGLRAKWDAFNKGIIVSVLGYLGLIAWVTYYLESRVI